MSSLPESIKKIRSKMKALEWSQAFSHYNSMGAFRCHGNQSSNLIWPKTYCNFSPTLVMLQIKFDRNWPAGLRDIHVWKCLRTDARTDARTHGRTPDRPVYYKLTLWAFGSGELKSRFFTIQLKFEYVILFPSNNIPIPITCVKID